MPTFMPWFRNNGQRPKNRPFDPDEVTPVSNRASRRVAGQTNAQLRKSQRRAHFLALEIQGAPRGLTRAERRREALAASYVAAFTDGAPR